MASLSPVPPRIEVGVWPDLIIASSLMFHVEQLRGLGVQRGMEKGWLLLLKAVYTGFITHRSA